MTLIDCYAYAFLLMRWYVALLSNCSEICETLTVV